MSFNHSTGFTIEGGVFSYVHGSQVNHYNRIVENREAESTPYDEYFKIKVGTLRLLKEVNQDVSYERLANKENQRENVQWKSVHRVTRTSYATEIHPESLSIFTAVAYSGPKAAEAWEEDFRTFSKAHRNTNMFQLFGINQSRIPWLIFYGELVPVGHFWDRLPSLSRFCFYLSYLTMPCLHNELWMDSQRGTIIRGLEGPKYDYPLPFLISDSTFPPIPSSTQFLEENAIWHYLCDLPLKEKSESLVIRTMALEKMIDGLKFQPRGEEPLQPIIFSNSTLTTVAVGSNMHEAVSWQEGWFPYRSSHHNMGWISRHGRRGGNTDPHLLAVVPAWVTSWTAWLSQASYIFHKLGISMDDDLSDLHFLDWNIGIKIPINCCETMRRRRQKAPPIYLFIRNHNGLAPPRKPLCHLWSFDAEGRTSISKRRCRFLGLPTRRLHYDKCEQPRSTSWPTSTYRKIHQWQLDRGFDPTTTDFARYLGYPEWDIVTGAESARLEVLQSDKAPVNIEEDPSLDSLFRDTVHQTEGLQKSDSHRPSFWAAFAASLSWNAVEDSEIPAMAL